MNCPNCKESFYMSESCNEAWKEWYFKGLQVRLTCNKCNIVIDLINKYNIFISISMLINENCLSILNKKLLFNMANHKYEYNSLTQLYCNIYDNYSGNSILIEDKIKEIFPDYNKCVDFKKIYKVNQVEVNKLVALLKSIEENICFA